MHAYWSSDGEIERWHNIHLGERCCIVGNGPSLKDVDLTAIDVPTFGVNRAWMVLECSYYVIGDKPQFEHYEMESGKHISNLWPLFSTKDGPRHSTRVRSLCSTRRQFSLDLHEGVHLNNTVTVFAMQVAVWMGFATIFLVGVDCSGAHFDGGDDIPEKKFSNQREAYGYVAGFLAGTREIVNLSPGTRVFAFPRRRFVEVFPSAPVRSPSSYGPPSAPQP